MHDTARAGQASIGVVAAVVIVAIAHKRKPASAIASPRVVKTPVDKTQYLCDGQIVKKL